MDWLSAFPSSQPGVEIVRVAAIEQSVHHVLVRQPRQLDGVERDVGGGDAARGQRPPNDDVQESGATLYESFAASLSVTRRASFRVTCRTPLLALSAQPRRVVGTGTVAGAQRPADAFEDLVVAADGSGSFMAAWISAAVQPGKARLTVAVR